MNLIQQLINELEGFLPKGAPEEQVNGALERDERAKAAGFETKAIDAQAGEKALEAVKALEEAQKADRDSIAALTASIEAVKGELLEAKAFRARSEKALADVKNSLVTLNTKPELTAPPEQEKLAAIETATKSKIEAAEGGKASGALTLKRFEYGADGRPVVKPI